MPPPGPCRTERARLGREGYSLIEILTVLTMVGILASIAYPRLDLTSYRMGAATQALQSTLLSAQRLAVMKQHDVVVSFDAANQRVRVHLDGGAPSDATHAGVNNGSIDSGETVTYYPLEGDAGFGMGGATAFAESGITYGDALSISRMQDGMPAVTFHRNGSVSERGAIYLTSRRALQGSGHAADTRLIVIERSTGRPSTYSFDASTWRREF